MIITDEDRKTIDSLKTVEELSAYINSRITHLELYSTEEHIQELQEWWDSREVASIPEPDWEAEGYTLAKPHQDRPKLFFGLF